jgi:hypothetical protein
MVLEHCHPIHFNTYIEVKNNSIKENMPTPKEMQPFHLQLLIHMSNWYDLLYNLSYKITFLGIRHLPKQIQLKENMPTPKEMQPFHLQLLIHMSNWYDLLYNLLYKITFLSIRHSPKHSLGIPLLFLTYI